ncbi:DUF3558 domain-containing protein [Nocardia terpenica]|uniref:DUF3558 domain-containing protein n=1 Tax=Nocardia terpenica TaxID=455432 RepID=A0A291RHS4_9NOCA|nr:DUF3558 domain-containing protein [Nocardia terpenica]ATL66632.1 hypothetical protein CRH09_10850 [Nocardia terpenica]
MKPFSLVVVLASTALLAVGCSGTDNAVSNQPLSSPSTESKPSISASVKPAPTQPSNGRKPVSFDPCVGLGDDVITKAGFDPGTRKRADQVHDDYAFIACTFERKQDVRGQVLGVGDLTVSSTNVSLDEFRKRQAGDSTEINVNGRAAITYKRPESEACFVVMTGPDGTVDVQVSSTAALTDWNACDHAQKIAGVIETALPK